MENNLVKSGAEISRKKRSLDIRSLYRFGVSSNENKNSKRKSGADDDGEFEKKKKKKKRTKEVSLGSFGLAGKRIRSRLEKVHDDEPSSTTPSLEGLPPRPKGKLSSVSGPSSILLSLKNSGNAIRIPKRPRGFVGRKKFENHQVSIVPGSTFNKADGSVDLVAKLDGDHKDLLGEHISKRVEPVGVKSNPAYPTAESNDDLEEKTVFLKVKRNVGVDDSKKGRSGKATSAPHAEVEEVVHLIVNNSDASSSKKRHCNHRKRKDMASSSEGLVVKVGPLVESSMKTSDPHDEDEENLEQNAARMLSSRFDPSCTQFSSESKSLSTKGLSSFISSDEDFPGREINTSAGSELAPSDAANRVLRPRKQHKVDGFSRKRRHFYEIFSRDLDAYRVLNRRIKVFWPLDESWYYGLVSDYSPETKLHHIKYDDRDEEWIDLQNEKFKLLLLPSEAPQKAEPKEAGSGKNNEYGDGKDLPSDDSLANGYMDSEPIISWLVRSSQRVKSSHPGSSKRQKTSHLLSKMPPKLPAKAVSTMECLEMGDPLERDSSKLCYDYALPNRSSDHTRVEDSLLGGSSISRGGNSPVVYIRRRFRKKDKALVNMDKKACGSLPVPSMVTVRKSIVSIGLVESEGLLWSPDGMGLLKLTIPFVESLKFRFQLGFPVSTLHYTSVEEDSWLIRALFLLKYGTVMTMQPNVHLQILFVDNVMGLRFSLFEGSLKQAMEFVFLLLAIFCQPDQFGKPVDMLMPVTSIRLKLSCVEDLRKQHVFAFCSFSGAKFSKWLYLDSKLQQNCFILKQLPLSDCTSDRIKALESWRNQLPMSSSSQASSANEGLWKESMHGIMAKVDTIASSHGATDLSSSKYYVKHGKDLPCALPFTAAPFLVSLHLKCLLEKNVASLSVCTDDSLSSFEHSKKTCSSVACSHSLIREYSKNIQEVSPVDGSGISLMEVGSSNVSHHAEFAEAAETTECSDGDQVKLFHNWRNGKFDVAGPFANFEDPDKNAGDGVVQSQETGCVIPELKQLKSSQLLVNKGDGLGVATSPISTQSSDLALNMNDNIFHRPKVIDPGLTWHHSKSSLVLSSGNISGVSPGGKSEFVGNGFGNGPRKPRTQVKYSLPGLDSSSKHKALNLRGTPFHRIRKANDKRASDVSKHFLRNLEILACDANVLITVGEKGWRECGARVELERADHNEWKLAVKLSGTTKYSYKAHQFLQPGSTNRYTHAMMWRGGKDWVLEFPDRNQWVLFKEMHEECFNRNLRAASVKNIPIPGVQLIEESDDNGTEVPFLCSSPNYIQQVETDAEMAMDPAHVLYDMDSEDEMWISEHQKSSVQGSKCDDGISEELLERTMDMFEKVAYAQQRDDFRLDEIEEFLSEVGPMEFIKSIYEHWQRKRLRKGMPLIRHLQPPLWERYQQQVKAWEQAVAKANTALCSSGCHDKASSLEKPPMFAFCLKPRGLDMLNKGTKQRSHRRFSISGNNYALIGDYDGLYAPGRRSNGYTFGDEKFMCLGNGHEYIDTSPSFKPSARTFSSRDAGGFGHLSLTNDSPEWNHYSKHYRKKLNIGSFRSPNDVKIFGPFNNQRISCKRNGLNRWNMCPPRWPNQTYYQSEASMRHGIEQLDGSALHEFRLRDASGAAQHALNMARLKREKAQRLLYRADLATHKAVVALMTAEAIKASSEDPDENDSFGDDSTGEDSDGNDMSSDDSDSDENTS